MTKSNIRQQILEQLETLPPEQVKTLLLTWLTSSSGDLEDFEQLVTNQAIQTTEESFEYGEIDAALNFQPLTEAQMVQQSQSALEAYRSTGSGVAHDRVREWADSLGTEQERPCPR
ncbi:MULTISPECIES: hypothetical protein [unclassified Nostoc]|uniref:hypothetical protein n=1 Tax=unclassified Nostoc TaxID=2593658 RepID=UPI00083DFF8A|nr:MULTISPECIES: hypothetical protein [unclassified Nostoc]ODG96218.1 hypothetical protein A4S05_19595 [Nostoc sp. KVJ20]QHG20772.1 hypothetical protein GJB62_33335 [Nostoc sp. ATCC 53789]RCJ25261.1 hypothetical protein A6V25_21420 [Nostoc sp. ATCC 53789]